MGTSRPINHAWWFVPGFIGGGVAAALGHGIGWVIMAVAGLLRFAIFVWTQHRANVSPDAGAIKGTTQLVTLTTTLTPINRISRDYLPAFLTCVGICLVPYWVVLPLLFRSYPIEDVIYLMMGGVPIAIVQAWPLARFWSGHRGSYRYVALAIALATSGATIGIGARFMLKGDLLPPESMVLVGFLVTGGALLLLGLAWLTGARHRRKKK